MKKAADRGSQSGLAMRGYPTGEKLKIAAGAVASLVIVELIVVRTVTFP